MMFFDYCTAAIIHCYSGLLDCVRVLVFPLVGKMAAERCWDLDKRQKLPSPVRDFRNKKVVWIHAASLGETKLLLKFVAMLHERHNDELYVVTATTRTGVAFLEKNRHPSFCAIGFLPIDTLFLVNRINNHYNITRLWILETELWPALLFACRQKKIPVGIVNGRIEVRSFTWYKRLRWFLAPLFRDINPVFAQTDDYAARFAALGIPATAIHTVGNIKGHLRIERPDRSEWLHLRNALNIGEYDFVVTAGCMHSGEGTPLQLFFSTMQQLGYPCKLIIIPRHLDETAVVESEFARQVLHLRECATKVPWNICIIEKVGILDDMYRLADAAIIGGTFIPIGGHNVWDAACFGIPVFFGTYYEKQQESCTTLLDAGVGFSADNGAALATRMYEVVKQKPMQFLNAQQAFITAVNTTRSRLEPLLP